MDELSYKCKKIKLFLTDVDGVLTDAGMYYTENGDELKKFNTLDGGGLLLLKYIGIKRGILTSEKTKLVERRAEKLRLDYAFQGVQDKLSFVNNLCNDLNLKLEEIAYIGDDINDIPLLQNVGVSASVPNNFLNKSVNLSYITKRQGGQGAVREYIEWILNQRQEYDIALEKYFNDKLLKK